MYYQICNKNYYCREIEPKEAREMVKKFHYSHKCVSNSKVHIGIFNIVSNRLCGVLQLGPSMNGYKTSKKFHESKKCMELNRMVMDDSEPRNSESQAISLCFKYLKKYTDLDYLISFSDGKEENVGYIYQATNWDYVGYKLSSSFYDLDGDIVHSVTVWHRYKEKHKDRDIKTTNEILCDNFDNVSIITSKQHIYLYKLNKKINFLLENKQYPKKDKENSILKRKIIKKDGIIYDSPITKVFTDEKLSPSI